MRTRHLFSFVFIIFIDWSGMIKIEIKIEIIIEIKIENEKTSNQLKRKKKKQINNHTDKVNFVKQIKTNFINRFNYENGTPQFQ